MLITRRDVIITGTAVTLAGIAGAARAAVPTSGQEIGPFYPVQHLADTDADLTRVRGLSGVAKGTPINVVGRVLDMKGNLIPGAQLQLWQANAAGRYRHSGDTHDAPLDPNFQGFAILRADRQGQFRFRTIKPGTYPIGGGQFRTRHIHFDIEGQNERLISQMYFPGEALNATDSILASADPKDSVMSRSIAPLSGDPNALAFAWDIVLDTG